MQEWEFAETHRTRASGLRLAALLLQGGNCCIKGPIDQHALYGLRTFRFSWTERGQLLYPEGSRHLPTQSVILADCLQHQVDSLLSSPPCEDTGPGRGGLGAQGPRGGEGRPWDRTFQGAGLARLSAGYHSAG